ncbi:hypothetical protein [Zhongshania sp. BJYM1]|jgi:hypothetical protein|uniref:hypothetical protein n=1 Tax=Zhongshania aquatica TaxID=2965069 RepID=UPI0022B486C9|nr:hypothetical protein [Marortus sp. BJYM1]
MGLIKIIAIVSALILNNSAFAERQQETKTQALIAMWSSWVRDLKPIANDTAWPELRKIDARFHIETLPAQLNLSKGDRVIFTVSPVGMSFSSKF